MPVQQATAVLSEEVQLNNKFFQLFFEMKEPNQFDFQAGQYISIAIPNQQARRSYSIASEPAKNHGFELLIDAAPQGIGTKYLASMKPGDELHFMGPMGLFTFPAQEQLAKEQSLIFIATGSGIAPHRSMILDLLQTRGETREIWLYWGLRYTDDLFWTEEFEELAKAFPNFHFHVTLSRATEDWPLCRGRVTDCLRIHDLPAEAGYYLCGNQAMIHDVMALLENDKHIPKEFIHHEKFY